LAIKNSTFIGRFVIFMSLKLVELQVALPRTQDIGKLQEQLQQKGQIGQEQLAQAAIKDQKKNESHVHSAEKGPKSTLDTKTGHNGNGHSSQMSERKAKENKNEVKAVHPYKGAHLDIEG
jgi:hypothetical protein